MKTPLALATLGFAQFLIFFRDPGHFFMGDSLIWMGRRHQSVGEFFGAFLSVDQGGWYRPLAQRVVPSILYPLVGLEPIAYRIVGFTLFFACTIALYLFVHRLTDSRRTALFAALFFAPHQTHAFVSYDVAFTPELFLFLFHIACAWAYFTYLKTKNSRMLWASVGFFVAALLSKEAAVSIPLTLVAIWLLAPRTTRASVQSLVPHFAVLGLYLTFAIGYLHVRDIDIAQLLERPGEAGGRGYLLIAGGNVIDNLKLATTWAIGIPRGPQSGDPPMGSRGLLALQLFGIVIALAAIGVLFTDRRKLLLLGLLWFLTSVSPTLPLVDHFLPYYLFVPLAGMSLAVAVILDWACQRLWEFSRPLAVVPAGLLFVFVAVQARIADRVQQQHYVLGQSAKNAWNSLQDLKALYPVLPTGATLLVRNEELPPVDWDQGYGQVFQLGYQDPSMVTRYSIDGATVTLDELREGRTFVLQWSNGHLIDRTLLTLQRPDVFLQSSSTFHALELSATDIRTGNSYTMRVPSMPNAVIEVLYAFNGMPSIPFQTTLDAAGSATFTTSAQTVPGTYTFLALRRAGETGWTLVDRSITVK